MFTFSNNNKIWLRLAFSIWVVLILAWTGVIIMDNQHNHQAAIEQAEGFSMSMHESTLAGLTAMMITKTMSQRDVLLDQIKRMAIIRELRVVPSKIALDGVLGPDDDETSRNNLKPDAIEAEVIRTGNALVEVREDGEGLYLLAIRPTPNSRNYLGKDCVKCHDAAENSVLGVISMKISLEKINQHFIHQQHESLRIALGVSVLLFMFIWALIVAARKSLLTAETAATTDALTGLSNRRGFMVFMQNVLNRNLHSSTATGIVMMFDLDHFKNINDVHGHFAGDAVLSHIGALLLEESRKTDLAARIGGEEFAMLLPGADEHIASVIAERIRQRISASEIKHEGKTLHITVSIGMTAISAQDERPEQPLARADEALYQAKHEGRNRVVFTS